MCKPFYAAFTMPNGKDHGVLFADYDLFHSVTFSPETRIHCIIPLETKGKTYKERRAYVKNQAVEYSNNIFPGLAWFDIAEISAYFEKAGRRYGLLKEFRENGIC